MPQVDLEILVTSCAGGGNDRKIVCETLADGGVDDNPPMHEDIPEGAPPESFWLSKDAEYDWFDRNAFCERKESTKGNSNSSNLNPTTSPGSNSNSRRFSVNLKSKASIIGLPKTQKTTFVDSRRKNCKPANIRLFPKRSVSVGKSTGSMAEPSSPKVSCMGRVRSKRGRRRSNSLTKIEKPVETPRIGSEKQKRGFYSKVMSMFRSKKSLKKPVGYASRRAEEVVEPQRKSISIKVHEIPASIESMSEPPSLGGMIRFASGRRSDSWSAEKTKHEIC